MVTSPSLWTIPSNRTSAKLYLQMLICFDWFGLLYQRGNSKVVKRGNEGFTFSREVGNLKVCCVLRLGYGYCTQEFWMPLFGLNYRGNWLLNLFFDPSLELSFLPVLRIDPPESAGCHPIQERWCTHHHPKGRLQPYVAIASLSIPNLCVLIPCFVHYALARHIKSARQTVPVRGKFTGSRKAAGKAAKVANTYRPDLVKAAVIRASRIAKTGRTIPSTDSA